MEPTTTPFRLNMSPNMTPSYSTSEKFLTAFRLSRKAIWRQDFTWCNRTPGLLLEDKTADQTFAFCIFILYTNSQYVSLTAQLVEHCISIAEVIGSNLVQA